MSKRVLGRAAAIPPSQRREQRGAKGMKWSAERSGVNECVGAVDRRCGAAVHSGRRASALIRPAAAGLVGEEQRSTSSDICH